MLPRCLTHGRIFFFLKIGQLFPRGWQVPTHHQRAHLLLRNWLIGRGFLDHSLLL